MTRVHELAKQLNKTSSEIIEELRKYNVPVSSHASQLTDQQVRLLQRADKPALDYEDGTYLVADKCFIQSSHIMDVSKLAIELNQIKIDVVMVNQIYVGWSLICNDRNAYWNFLKELSSKISEQNFVDNIVKQYANKDNELNFWLRSVVEAKDAFNLATRTQQYNYGSNQNGTFSYMGITPITERKIKQNVSLYFLENSKDNIEIVYKNIISILPENLEHSRESYMKTEVSSRHKKVVEKYGNCFEKKEAILLDYNNLNSILEIKTYMIANSQEVDFWETAVCKKHIDYEWAMSYIAILREHSAQLKQNYIRCVENDLVNRLGIIKERKIELLKDLRDLNFEEGLELYKSYKQQYYDLKAELKELYMSEEVSAIYDVYLEYFKMGWVQISSHLNSISKSRAKKKDIPQKDLEQALMYFYEADTVADAEKLREQSNYIENRKYGLIGESEVHYALKWLDKKYIIMEPKTYGKYGERILILSNPEYIDVVQEYDHIIIGEQGIFIIETKNFVGKLIVDEQQNWIREKADGTVEGERNPLQQLRRHEKLLRSIVGEDVNIISVICMAHPKLIIEGSENCTIPLIKSDMLVEYIENYKTDINLTREKMEDYQKILENHMPQSLDRSN